MDSPDGIRRRGKLVNTSGNDSSDEETETFTFIRTTQHTTDFVEEKEEATKSLKNALNPSPSQGQGQLHSQYDQYDTIDWIRDGIIDRRQRYSLDMKVQHYSGPKWKKWLLYIYLAYYRSQGWILILISAFLMGLIGGTLSIAIDWLSDTRLGFCKTNPFLTKKLCCEMHESGESDNVCTDWVSWNYAVSINDRVGGWFFDYFVYCAACSCFAVLAAWFVKSINKWGAGSGIPELKTILGGFVIHGFNSWRTLIVKVVGLVFSVSSGLSLGKEGPMVHVGGCVTNIATRFFAKYKDNQAKKREMLSAGAAMGISVAFGAPIGGVLFSLEEISYYFPHKTLWRAFFGATIAALVLQLMNPFHNGKLVIYSVDYTHSWLWFELIPYVFIGIIGGVLGAIFIRINLKIVELRRNTVIKDWPVTEAFVVALVTAIVSFGNDYLRGNASEILDELYSECVPGDINPSPLCNMNQAWGTISELMVAFMLRYILTCFTFGIKVPSGLFIPTMGMGAMIGRAIGTLVELAQTTYKDFFLFAQCKHQSQCVSPGTYALMGSTAFLGGSTRMTVSLTVIMFEITGDVDFIVPLMLVVMSAKWVGDMLGHEGVYERIIRLNEYPFLEDKTEYRFKARADDVMKPQPLGVLTLHGNTVGRLMQVVNMSPYTGWPVVTNEASMHLVGYIARSELRFALQQAMKTVLVDDNTPCFFAKNLPQTLPPVFVDLRPWMDTAPIQISPRTPLNIIFDMFAKLGLRYVLVVHHGKLAGILTKKDILQHIGISFNKELRSFVVQSD